MNPCGRAFCMTVTTPPIQSSVRWGSPPPVQSLAVNNFKMLLQLLIIFVQQIQSETLEMCSLGHWWCQSRNETGELDDASAPCWCQIFPGQCISVYKRCRGRCVTSAEAGFSEGYSWCAESQQCIPPGVKCAVMWGVGCGKSSFFCWRGNVCLPKSLPCNGNKDWRRLSEQRVLLFRILYTILPAVRFLQLSVWPGACDSRASKRGQEKLRDSGAHPYNLASFTRHGHWLGHQVLIDFINTITNLISGNTEPKLSKICVSCASFASLGVLVLITESRQVCLMWRWWRREIPLSQNVTTWKHSQWQREIKFSVDSLKIYSVGFGLRLGTKHLLERTKPIWFVASKCLL